MTAAGVAKYRQITPALSSKTAVTGKVKPDQRPLNDVNHSVHVVQDNEEVSKGR